MHPQPSPGAATLLQQSFPDLTYLPGSMSPQPPHAEPEHRVTASRAVHLPPTPSARHRQWSRRERRCAGRGRGEYRKKRRPGSFGRDKALSAAASATEGPSSLALLLVSASPTRTSPRAKSLAVVPTASSCPGPSRPRRRTARTDATRPCPGSGGPPTLPTPPPRPHHIGGPPIPGQASCGRPPCVPAPPGR